MQLIYYLYFLDILNFNCHQTIFDWVQGITAWKPTQR